MWTIRNNEDLAELATDRNEVMFGKVRHRKPEYMKNLLMPFSALAEILFGYTISPWENHRDYGLWE